MPASPAALCSRPGGGPRRRGAGGGERRGHRCGDGGCLGRRQWRSRRPRRALKIAAKLVNIVPGPWRPRARNPSAGSGARPERLRHLGRSRRRPQRAEHLLELLPHPLEPGRRAALHAKELLRLVDVALGGPEAVVNRAPVRRREEGKVIAAGHQPAVRTDGPGRQAGRPRARACGGCSSGRSAAPAPSERDCLDEYLPPGLLWDPVSHVDGDPAAQQPLQVGGRGGWRARPRPRSRARWGLWSVATSAGRRPDAGWPLSQALPPRPGDGGEMAVKWHRAGCSGRRGKEQL
jgi:hypothetical protein